jgi:hypothetical protein
LHFVVVLVSPSTRLLHAEAQKVHYHPYCQWIRRDQRKFKKGWEIAQKENLNLARLPIPPRGHKIRENLEPVMHFD